MKILSITHCSALKNYPPTLLLGRLKDSQKIVAEDWISRVNNSKAIDDAKYVYNGRWIKLLFSQNYRDNSLFVISAGFGLISADTKIPSYDCTIAKGQTHSLYQSCNSKPDLSEWWDKLKQNKYSNGSISKLANKYDIVLASLTSQYLKLVKDDIENVSKKLILFTGVGSKLNFINKNIIPSPYTNAFDGPASPFQGLKSDFAQRCHYDFICRLKKFKNTETAYFSVNHDMKNWPESQKLKNHKFNDEELIGLINKYKSDFTSIGSMHKFFRHNLNVACEQKRFTKLYRYVWGLNGE